MLHTGDGRAGKQGKKKRRAEDEDGTGAAADARPMEVEEGATQEGTRAGEGEGGRGEEEETLGERVAALELAGAADGGSGRQEEEAAGGAGSGAPRAHSLQVLLTQALASQDGQLLEKCLAVGDEKVSPGKGGRGRERVVVHHAPSRIAIAAVALAPTLKVHAPLLRRFPCGAGADPGCPVALPLQVIGNTVRRLRASDAAALLASLTAKLQARPSRGMTLLPWIRAALLQVSRAARRAAGAATSSIGAIGDWVDGG